MALKEVYQAKKVKEAVMLLDKYKDKAKIIAGGTDIIIKLRHKRIQPDVMIDISSIKEMNYIKEVGEEIEIGAATTFGEIRHNSLLQNNIGVLIQAARSVGSPQIQNTGTIGGNICNASPAADLVPPLMALDAKVIIKGLNSERELELEKFFLGKGQIDLDPTELLYAIRFKKISALQGIGLYKLGFRRALAISKVASAVFVELDRSGVCVNMRIANGSLAQNTIRERETEQFFIEKILNEETIKQGIETLSQNVAERLMGRSNAEFKAQAIKGVFKKALQEALLQIHHDREVG